MKDNEIKNIKISKLTLLEKNPRRISKEQMQKLEKSLIEDPDFLKCRPILVNDSDGQLQVYAGNQRVRAAKKLKWKEVPCIVKKDLDPKVMKARTIKDNKTYGEFDFDMLANEWDIDILKDAGFCDYELPGLDLEENINEKEYDESITDDLDLIVTFNIKIPNEEATSFENQLDKLISAFPTAKKEKKI